MEMNWCVHSGAWALERGAGNKRTLRRAKRCEVTSLGDGDGRRCDGTQGRSWERSCVLHRDTGTRKAAEAGNLWTCLPTEKREWRRSSSGSEKGDLGRKRSAALYPGPRKCLHLAAAIRKHVCPTRPFPGLHASRKIGSGTFSKVYLAYATHERLQHSPKLASDLRGKHHAMGPKV
ncbi:uncharacterized protein LOC100480096 isoform X2 [Ailuropoda melanoleuca]|uniref:uncharacterized protein LOC100480096 isoform X2 n=1 Tax=Ailuropoda melanoleuca TaxID=9646 RepID=UPI001493F2A9|nr:uncharacterized protein LOC100480096 isoform X2 [Ailuropoda melanoleuca]XP_034524657.1 uncharacterized protein LOC100480096 isoform X2 [Ailuropoda melanoleuca]XP_034524658.1 uncharacterized protein LOC100480096 isoform X2 [Ailuropoda melanoleuca]